MFTETVEHDEQVGLLAVLAGCVGGLPWERAAADDVGQGWLRVAMYSGRCTVVHQLQAE
jgi:hypothetical protein